MTDFADQLIAELDASTEWPLEREEAARQAVTQRRAWRKGEAHMLRPHDWDLDRAYIHDALAKRIADGYADFLFAEDPIFKAAAGDKPESGDGTQVTPQQEALDELVAENRLPARLRRAERMVCSEGEGWWKIHTNPAVAPCALLTWCSRLNVVPFFYGDRVLAAAFVSDIAHTVEPRTVQPPDTDADDYVEVFWRYAEVHTAGRIVNVLYKGTCDKLGKRVDLTQRAETAAYPEDIVHGLGMLAGRVVNDLDDDDTLGVSDYDHIADELRALDEAVTIAAENTRLTAVDRIAVQGKFRQQDGTFDASLTVFELEQQGTELGEGDGRPPIVQLEKRYDAEPLWLHISRLVHTILRNVGLVGEFVGDNVEGHDHSGTAIRLRFIPTTNAADGKLREWRHDLPHILLLMMQAGPALAANGRPAPTDVPTVEFGDALPIDESQRTVDVTVAVAAEVMSRKTAIAELHPEWDDDQVAAELKEITSELAAGAPTLSPPPTPPLKVPDPTG